VGGILLMGGLLEDGGMLKDGCKPWLGAAMKGIAEVGGGFRLLVETWGS